MKNTILIGLLLLALGVVITTGFSRRPTNVKQSADGRLNVKDLPDHGLNIIRPFDPAYSDLVSKLLKGKPNPFIESLAPFSIFIENTGKHAVVACALNWEMITPDGKTLMWRREYTNLLGLMENELSDVREGFIIEPNSTWFFTPAALEIGNDTADRISDRPEAASELNRLLPELSHFTSITVSLDGAFFNDGSFVGPDDTQFFAKVEAMRNGRRDSFLAAINDRKLGKTDSEVFKRVKEIADATVELSNTSPAADYYTSFRQAAAAELLRMKAVQGEAKAFDWLQIKLRRPWPDLRKN